MTLKQQLLQEIEQLPEPFLPQILQFIQTLKPQPNKPHSQQLDTIAQRCASLPRRDNRSTDEILNYNEQGLPQ
jgi:hypothetical protein